jgi:hypothetical protein
MSWSVRTTHVRSPGTPIRRWRADDASLPMRLEIEQSLLSRLRTRQSGTFTPLRLAQRRAAKAARRNWPTPWPAQGRCRDASRALRFQLAHPPAAAQSPTSTTRLLSQSSSTFSAQHVASRSRSQTASGRLGPPLSARMAVGGATSARPRRWQRPSCGVRLPTVGVARLPPTRSAPNQESRAWACLSERKARAVQLKQGKRDGAAFGSPLDPADTPPPTRGSRVQRCRRRRCLDIFASRLRSSPNAA